MHGAQVSWCKLEVKLDGPKKITAGCASRQHPPPLIVAALNLKTTLNAQVNNLIASPAKRCMLCP